MVDALKFSEIEGVKVCLKEDRVTHRFVYFEEWILNPAFNKKVPKEKLDDSEDSPLQADCSNDDSEKYLKQVYFGKFLCDGLSNQIHK